MAGCGVASGAQQVLAGVEAEDSGDRVRIKLLAGAPIGDYRHFFMDGPLRIVLDVKGNWKGPKNNIVHLESDLIKRVRIGEHGDKIRIVLDAKKKVPEASVTFRESPEGLEIVLVK